MELDELESLWEQNNESSADTSASNDPHPLQQHPVNMHLFYGHDIDRNIMNSHEHCQHVSNEIRGSTQVDSS